MALKANKPVGAHTTPFSGVRGGDMIEHGIRLEILRRAYRNTWWLTPLGTALLGAGIGAYLGEDQMSRGALAFILVGAVLTCCGIVGRLASAESLTAICQAYGRYLNQWNCQVPGYASHSEYIADQAAQTNIFSRRFRSS